MRARRALLVVLAAVTAVGGCGGEDPATRLGPVATPEPLSPAAQRKREKMIREQRPVRGNAKGTVAVPAAGAPHSEVLAARRAMFRAFKKDILADARQRIRAGTLDGHARYVHCDPLVRRADGKRITGDEDVVTRRLGRYDCVVVSSEVLKHGKVVGYLGSPFVGTIDFQAGTWTFCKDNKVPGERGEALAKAKLSRECVGAEGSEEIGNGYAMPAPE